MLAALLTVSAKGIAQDTLRLTSPQAEKAFIEKNLLLLASGFQIEAAEAQVVQARLWENPTVFIDVNAIVKDASLVLVNVPFALIGDILAFI